MIFDITYLLPQQAPHFGAHREGFKGFKRQTAKSTRYSIYLTSLYLVTKIPSKGTSKGSSRTKSSTPEGASASQPSRGRSTLNSIRAGQTPSALPSSRVPSQDPIAERVESRISASRERTAKRRTSLAPETILNPNPLSPTIQRMTGPNPSASTSTGSGQNNPAAAMTAGPRRMPKPGEKNAPAFDPEKPEELGRFFERIEDWFAEDGIVDDDVKKRKIVKYLDADSEIQWKAFSKFEQGSFKDFKDQVMASYPKAMDVMKGSVTALKKRIKRIDPVDVDDRDELLSLIRIMTAEVGKLKKIQPAIHTNRELVELFLSRLTKDFATRIAHKLSVKRLVNAAAPAASPRNPEDMYDIEDVMEMANQTAMESANPFGKFLWTTESKESPANVKLEAAVARLEDSVDLQHKLSKEVDQKLANLQHSLQAKPVYNTGYAGPNGYNRGYAPASTNVHAGASNDCFYCRGNDGHRISECPEVRIHMDMGWIKKIENHLRLSDGSKIPRDGNKSMKEVVEALNKLRPGIVPMSKIQDKASLYQDVNMASYVQMNSGEDPTMRTVLEAVRRIGTDRVLELLNVQTQTIVADEEWNQNFDGVQ